MDFTLRPWEPGDADDLAKAANNPHIAANMRDMFPHPYAFEDAVRFIEMTMQSEPRNIMAIVVDGKASGGIGVFPQNDIHRLNAEMGYWLAEPHWGKGIISRAISWMTEYAFKHFEITRIYAIPFGTNIASQKALEKAGYKLEARFENTIIKYGVLKDELVYAFRKPANQ